MKKIPTHFLKYICLPFLVLLLFSCKNKNLIRKGDSLPTAFKKAMTLYQKEKYGDAAEAFNTVIDVGRGTDYGREAQYYLAESYFKDGRYLLASSEYERYISEFPRSDKRQDAQFKEAVSYYHLSPRYKLDQKYTNKAIEKFQLYNSRYPNSDQAEQAAKYITDLRSKLADKLYHSADLYKRTDEYEAAIIYYNLTIDNYPESIWAQRALVDEIQTYNNYASRSIQSKQQERYQKAVDTYEKFIQLFPNGKYRSEAENYVDNSRSALAKLRTNKSSSSNKATASADNTEETN
ncbi:MAG TPA: outer membrane protein assembly factor BamD [Balneolaceae bacterium]|nr:outer membrane protein assembly factor BamD [Balneolaceae bacterium]